jgi:hypothetical protein
MLETGAQMIQDKKRRMIINEKYIVIQVMNCDK